MEKNPNKIPPHVYESINPAMQMFYVATHLFADQSGKHEIHHLNPALDEMEWKNSRINSTEKLYFLREKSPVTGGSMMTMTLSHYPESSKNTPTLMFAVTQYPDAQLSPVRVYDSKKQPMDLTTKGREIATRELLQILTEFAPEESAKIRDQLIDIHYQHVVGSYVLSKFADKPEFSFSQDSIKEALTDFNGRMEEIATDAIEQSLRTADTKHAQPFYTEAVIEAATTVRPPSRGNHYEAVDVAASAILAAKDLKFNWNNSINQEPKATKQVIQVKEKPVETQIDESKSDETEGDSVA